MPWQDVMHKFGKGNLHSGGKSGPAVKSQKQAVAIMYSEKRRGTDRLKDAKGKSRKHSPNSLEGLKRANRKTPS